MCAYVVTTPLGKCLNPSKLKVAKTLPSSRALAMEVNGEGGGQWCEGGRWVGRKKGGR